MSHVFELDGKLWSQLLAIDAELAEQVRVGGCRCGGRLDRADYPRKPRGDLGEYDEAYSRRISFCCALDGCRKRATPPSVRFLGRKVYVGAVVIIACVRYLGEVAGALGAPVRTVARWLSFWQFDFVDSSFWKVAAGLVMPPPQQTRLPASLLGRFGGIARDALSRMLRFVAPITTTSARLPMAVM